MSTKGVRLAGPLKRLLPTYARNLIVGTEVAKCRDQEGAPLALSKRLFVDAVEAEIEDLDDEGDSAAKLERLLAAAGGRLLPPPRAGQPARRNLRLIGRIAGLRRVDRRVLEFLLAVRMHTGLEEVTDSFPRLTLEAAARLVATAIAQPVERVRCALGPRGRLQASGLMSVQNCPDYIERKFPLSSVLPDLLVAEHLTRDDVLDAYGSRARAPARPWIELSAGLPGADLLLNVVRSAARDRVRGVNVLLHGPAGSGKSELVRAMAQELGLDLREACTREEGGSPAVEPRVAIIVECDQLVDDGRTVLLFDEIEDVLDAKGPPGPGHLGPSASRAWLDRRLERNRLPTIWTTREASRIDPALLSRFALALEVPAPEPEVRRALWAREVRPADHLAPADLDVLSTRFASTPAEIARATATARLAGGGAADARGLSTILESMARARSARAEPVRPSPASYRLECVNASADLEVLARRLRGWSGEEGGLAMLLHGVPGTGKSEWVQELGKRIGRPVLARRASDLESKWVGESEQNLARAFEEASTRGAILLFDEVDSFLLDRREATARHELQLTNEFLQQLESHAGVVACTTNLLERLDPAVLRRFPLKIEFRPVRLDQAVLLFEAYFGRALGAAAVAAEFPALPNLLAGIGPMTPGDFAAVARHLRITGELRSAEDALRLLREEVALKPDGARRVMGFSK